jgi:hypothetical protein
MTKCRKIENVTLLFTLLRAQPCFTKSCPVFFFDSKMMTENPAFLQALTNKAVNNWVNLNFSELVSNFFGNQQHLNLGEMCPIVRMSKCRNVRASKRQSTASCDVLPQNQVPSCHLVSYPVPCQLVHCAAEVPHRPCQGIVPNQRQQAHHVLESRGEKVECSLLSIPCEEQEHYFPKTCPRQCRPWWWLVVLWLLS